MPLAARVRRQAVELALAEQPERTSSRERAREAGQVGLQTGHGVGDGPRGVQVGRRPHRPREQLAGHRPPVLRAVAGDRGAQTPQRLAEGVLARGPPHEAPVERHQVGEPAGRLLRVVQEAQAARHEPGGHRVAAPRALDRDDERACDVVGAVAVRPVGDAVRRVLEDPDVVGQGPQVGEAGSRHGRRPVGERPRLVPGDDLGEQLLVGTADGGPRHRAAVRAGALAHRRAARVVAEQRGERRAHRLGVAERHQLAAPVGQQLAGVRVGRAHDRAPRADGVGERPADDLVGAVVRRDVDVAGREVASQLVQVDEAVHEAHVGRHAELPDAGLQRGPVGVPLLAQHLRVRGAEHDVEQVGVLGHDRRERLDDDLDALARRQQPEREQHGAAARDDALLGRLLVEVGADGDAVRDHPHLRGVDAAALLEQPDRLLGEHDQDVGAGGDPPGGLAQLRRRCCQDGVQGGDDRRADVLEQLVEVRPGVAAEDPELVLDAQDVDVLGVDEGGGRPVVLQVRRPQLEDHLGAVGVRPRVVRHRQLHGGAVGAGGGERAAQVVGERRDAAASWRRGAHQAHPGAGVVVLHVRAPSSSDWLSRRSLPHRRRLRERQQHLVPARVPAAPGR